MKGPVEVCPACRALVADAPDATDPELDESPAPAPPIPAIGDTPVHSRKTFRIPCPNGHVNVTPASLIGTQAVCPRCNAFYTLQMSDSLEHLEAVDREQRRRAEKEGKKWLTVAVFAAVFIVLSLIGMIAMTLTK